MPSFDVYAFADYSGAASEAAQRKAIALAVIDRAAPGKAAGERRVPERVEPRITQGLTRSTLLAQAQQLLRKATAEGQRVLLGFDHNYSFPSGFYEAVALSPWRRWEELLAWLHSSLTAYQGADGLQPRAWAAAVNALLRDRFQLAEGPFWGPHFVPVRRSFPYGCSFAQPLPFTLRERRLVEERCPRMKPIYQIGGAGSVGLQSIYGMYSLYELISFCREEGVPLHVWPYQGWDVPGKGHMLVEVYPTLYVTPGEKRTDAGDAAACAMMMYGQDRLGKLETMLSEPDFTPEERERVLLEGWVLGV